jgi:hypothetical protein
MQVIYCLTHQNVKNRLFSEEGKKSGAAGASFFRRPLRLSLSA